MKIIGINSSPRKNGNTATLVKEALAGAVAAGANVEEVDLYEAKLEFCRGCSTCLATGQCIIGDELEIIREKIALADGIIIGSPTYGLEPNAVMKNFMDRIGLFSVYTSALGDKYIVGISTAGAAGAKRVAQKLTQITGGFYKNGYVSGTLGASVGWEDIQKYPNYLAQAKRLGKKIVSDIERRRKYPTQKLLNKVLSALILKQMMKQNILKHKDTRMKAVYQYLHQKGIF